MKGPRSISTSREETRERKTGGATASGSKTARNSKESFELQTPQNYTRQSTRDRRSGGRGRSRVRTTIDNFEKEYIGETSGTLGNKAEKVARDAVDKVQNAAQQITGE